MHSLRSSLGCETKLRTARSKHCEVGHVRMKFDTFEEEVTCMHVNDKEQN